MTPLLDVNVLVALAWPNHDHHEDAHRWFAAARDDWATCPQTEAGFIRISMNARAVGQPISAPAAVALLDGIVTVGQHRFWEDATERGGLSLAVAQRVRGYRQVTDAQLLAVARAHGGVVATFDRGLLEVAGEAGAVELVPG